MYHDPEINAMSNVYDALKGLDNGQIKRIIDWVSSKFELDKYPDLKAGQRESDIIPQPAFAETGEPVIKRRGRKPRKLQAGIEETQPQNVPSGLRGFMKFDSLKEILKVSTVKRTSAKMLLVAAYLQEKENLKELTSYVISSRLKKIGEEIKHPSATLNSLISRKPPLLLQTGKHGDSEKSRRKFRVTEEGLKIARNYINE